MAMECTEIASPAHESAPQPAAHRHIVHHHSAPLRAGNWLFLLLMGSSIFAGCASTLSGKPATRVMPTDSPTVRPWEPVTVAVTVEQQGNVAAHTVHLFVTVAVTNHTSRDIKISIPDCNSLNPPVLIDLLNAARKTIWQTNVWNGMCRLMDPRDAVRLAPNATQHWTIVNDLSHGSVEYGNAPPGPPPLIANAIFTVRATFLQWHQGSVQDIGNLNVPQGQDVVGEATIVLR